MAFTYPAVTFAFPAYETEQTVLSLRAQMFGDIDIPQGKVLFFRTMDGKAVTRVVNTRAAVESRWSFVAVCDLVQVRQFFRLAEGQYIKYTHYDGTEHVIMLKDKVLPAKSDGKRGYIDQLPVDTYDINLVVDRWPFDANAIVS
jgi:hypothetical protein